MVEHPGNASLVTPTLLDICRAFPHGTVSAVDIDDATYILLHYQAVMAVNTSVLTSAVLTLVRSLEQRTIDATDLIFVVRPLCALATGPKNRVSKHLQRYVLTLLQKLCTFSDGMQSIADNGGSELLLTLLHLFINDSRVSSNVLMALYDICKQSTEVSVDPAFEDERRPASLLAYLLGHVLKEEGDTNGAVEVVTILLHALIIVSRSTQDFLSDIVSEGIITHCVTAMRRCPDLCCELLWLVMLENSHEFTSRGGIARLMESLAPEDTAVTFSVLRLCCHLFSLRGVERVIQELLTHGILNATVGLLQHPTNPDVRRQSLFLLSHLLGHDSHGDVTFTLSATAPLRTKTLRSLIAFLRQPLQDRLLETVQHTTACLWKMMATSGSFVQEANRLQAASTLLQLLTDYAFDDIVTHNTTGCLRELDCLDEKVYRSE